jgi:sec-independent protein translocase protein TatA
MFGSFGTTELIIILVILLLFFGAKKLPELSKSIGSSAKELRNAMKDDDDEPKNDQES